MMFHESLNFYAGRLSDGSVRLLQFKSAPERWPQATAHYPPDLLVFDHTIPPGPWASLIASVSNQGEENGRFYEAQAFHMNPRQPAAAHYPQAPMSELERSRLGLPPMV